MGIVRFALNFSAAESRPNSGSIWVASLGVQLTFWEARPEPFSGTWVAESPRCVEGSRTLATLELPPAAASVLRAHDRFGDGRRRHHAGGLCSDRLYFEPLTAEDVIEIARKEESNGRLRGAIVQFGARRRSSSRRHWNAPAFRSWGRCRI